MQLSPRQTLRLAFIFLLALGVMSLGSNSDAALIAAEDFDYPISSPRGGTSLLGANGGTGWTSSWDNPNAAFSDYRIGTGLTHPGLTTVGGSAFAQTDSAARRFLPRQDTGVVWVSLLGDLRSNALGSDMFRFYDGSSFTAVGSNDNIPNWTLFTPVPDAVDTGVGVFTGTRLALLRFDYDAGETTLWMDPDVDAFTGLGGVTSGSAIEFDNIQIYGRNGGRFDSIRIGTRLNDVGVTAIPEPASLAVTLLGITALAGYRRR